MTQEVKVTLTLEVDVAQQKADIENFIRGLINTHSKSFTYNKTVFDLQPDFNIKEEKDIYELEPCNPSEAQLAEFIDHIVDTKTRVKIQLRPQGMETAISKEAVNLCEVSTETNTYLFGGISEGFYDRLYAENNWKF